MGRRGPARTPDAIKLARGETRPSRLNGLEPLPRQGRMPAMPGDMDDEAKKAWRLVMRELRGAGVITGADAFVLRLFCDAWSRYRGVGKALDTPSHMDALHVLSSSLAMCLADQRTRSRWSGIHELRERSESTLNQADQAVVPPGDPAEGGTARVGQVPKHLESVERGQSPAGVEVGRARLYCRHEICPRLVGTPTSTLVHRDSATGVMSLRGARNVDHSDLDFHEWQLQQVGRGPEVRCPVTDRQRPMVPHTRGAPSVGPLARVAAEVDT
jgi:hypothetical protein